VENWITGCVKHHRDELCRRIKKFSRASKLRGWISSDLYINDPNKPSSKAVVKKIFQRLVGCCCLRYGTVRRLLSSSSGLLSFLDQVYPKVSLVLFMGICSTTHDERSPISGCFPCIGDGGRYRSIPGTFGTSTCIV
jgi:hypothetical protein